MKIFYSLWASPLVSAWWPLTSPLTFVSATGSLAIIFFSAAAAVGAVPFVGFVLVIGAFFAAMAAFGSVFDAS